MRLGAARLQSGGGGALAQKLRATMSATRCATQAARAVAQGDYVTMSFTGKDTAGNVVMSSDAGGGQDYAYQIGQKNEIPRALDEMVLGMEKGESKQARAAAKDVMGDRNDELVITVPRKGSNFDNAQPGMRARVQNGSETIMVLIKEVTDDTVTLDANNPLAGEDIDFDVTVKDVVSSEQTELLTIAGGCFWGPELAFQRVPGVLKTSVGYTNGHVEDPSYEQVCSGQTGHTEAVQIVYDKKAVNMDQLMEAFWGTMKDPTQVNGQGNDRGTQYRTGVYFHTDEQREAATKFIEAKEKELGIKSAIEVTPVDNWSIAEGYHQQYLSRGGPQAPRPQSAAKGCSDPIRCYG